MHGSKMVGIGALDRRMKGIVPVVHTGNTGSTLELPAVLHEGHHAGSTGRSGSSA